MEMSEQQRKEMLELKEIYNEMMETHRLNMLENKLHGNKEIRELSKDYQRIRGDVGSQILNNVSTIRLLKEIIRREGYDTAPQKIELHSPHYISVIGIGKDHMAQIIIDPDDYEALNQMLDEEDQS